MARHLAPGGLAVVDVWLPGRRRPRPLRRSADPRVRAARSRRRRNLVTKVAAAQHDAASGDRQPDRRSSRKAPRATAPVRYVRRDTLRLVSADELRDFAESAGLEVETLAGGYDLEPLGPGSERAIVVARR